MDDIISITNDPRLHALYFTYNDRKYIFSGWWMLDWIEDSKVYDSKEDFLNDPFFDGETIAAVADKITDVDYDLDP